MRKLIVLFLVLAWVPVTMHCDLESIPGLEFLQCSTDMPVNSDCKDDGCDAVESGLYKVEDDGPIISPSAFVLISVPAIPVSEDSSPALAGRTLRTVVPLGFLQNWQFVFRTALQPRAPSFAS